MNLLRSSATILVVQVGISILTATNFFILALYLSPDELGMWAILLTLSIIVVAIMTLGYHKAAIYYVGQQIHELETVISNGLMICAVVAVVLLAAATFFLRYLRHFFPEIPPHLLVAMTASVPLQLFLLYVSESSIAADLLVVVILSKASPIVIYVGGCLLLAAVNHINLNTIVSLYLSAMLIGCLISLGYLIARSRQRRAFQPRWSALQSCLRFGLRAQIGDLSQYLSNRVDLLLVGYWAGAAASGYYAMAVRLGEIVWYISNSVQLALSAKVAQTNNPGERARLTQRTVKYVMLISVLVAMAVAAGGAILLPVFLPQYVSALPLVLVLLPGTAAFSVFQIVVGGLIGEGQPVVATRLRLVLLGASLVLYLGLIPFLGGLGASLGTTLAYAGSALLATQLSARLSKAPFYTYFIWDDDDQRLVRALGGRLIDRLRLK